MGALTYEPVEGELDETLPVDLCKAAQSARKIMEYKDGVMDPSLMISGTTAGGAQPKLLAAIDPTSGSIRTGSDEIEEGWGAWLIKLTTGRDLALNIGCLEYAYSQMAQVAGLDVPESTLLVDGDGVRHFAVRRFDRKRDDPNERIHLHSYASMMHIDFRSDDLDYRDLLRTTLALTRDQREVSEQFRRMVFNVLAHNHDDHGKNFSFLMDADGAWRLSPAYDLVFCSNPLGGNWMAVDGKRTAISGDSLRAMGKAVGLSPNAANEVIDQVCAATEQWDEIAQDCGVNDGYRAMVDRELRSLRGQITVTNGVKV